MFHSVLTIQIADHRILHGTYHRIIRQTGRHIKRVCEGSPRVQIHFRILHSFRTRNRENLGSKNRFWIRRKENTLSVVKII